jgi:hypothetical protein
MVAYDISIKYLIAGYAIILSILAGYLISLFVRWKRLKHDLQTLEEIDQ